MHNYLVQAVLSAAGVQVGPYVLSESNGRPVWMKMENETPSTVFVNGCAVVCSSTSAAMEIIDNPGNAGSPMEFMQKIDAAMRERGLYADGAVAVLVEF